MKCRTVGRNFLVTVRICYFMGWRIISSFVTLWLNIKDNIVDRKSMR